MSLEDSIWWTFTMCEQYNISVLSQFRTLLLDLWACRSQTTLMKIAVWWLQLENWPCLWRRVSWSLPRSAGNWSRTVIKKIFFL